MQGSVNSLSHTAFHITEKEVVCIACDDTVAIGATCSVMRNNEEIGDCEVQERELCFSCVEGMHSVLDACSDCDGALRCVDNATHLLCGDGAVLNAGLCTPSTQQDSLLVTNNHMTKCSETHFADGTTCGRCPDSCVSCHNGSACVICAAGTSLSPVGECGVLERATVQTHNGAQACADAFFATGTACESCTSFGDGCTSCSAKECLSCSSGLVLDGGVCRKGDRCDAADGTVCTACVDGTLSLNSTDCVPVGDCAVYEDGKCVQCVDPLVLLADGTCAASDECTTAGDGVCLRCAAGMFADETGVCQCLSTSPSLTRSMRLILRDVCVQRNILHVV